MLHYFRMRFRTLDCHLSIQMIIKNQILLVGKCLDWLCSRVSQALRDHADPERYAIDNRRNENNLNQRTMPYKAFRRVDHRESLVSLVVPDDS